MSGAGRDVLRGGEARAVRGGAKNREKCRPAGGALDRGPARACLYICMGPAQALDRDKAHLGAQHELFGPGVEELEELRGLSQATGKGGRGTENRG